MPLNCTPINGEDVQFYVMISINLKMVIFRGEISEAMLQTDGSNILGAQTHFFSTLKITQKDEYLV